MPHKIVLHLHPVEVLAHAVRVDFDKNLSQISRLGIGYECIPYLKPGSELAKAAARALAKNSNLKVLFLQNHGIVIGGESIESVKEILFTVNNALVISPYYSRMDFSVPEFFNVHEGRQYIAIKDPEIQALVFDQVLFSRLHYDWCVSPDHVVFLGQRAFTYDSIESFVKFACASDEYPDLIFIRNVGVYVTAKFSIQKQLLLRCYSEIMIRQAPQQVLTQLSSAEVQELLGWEAEKNRVNLSQKYKTRQEV
jgi:rhamnose utilization protein RhaD (predicted bifunctional aldolase and dehydrogenase)